MRFVANLRTQTIEAFGQHGLLPYAFLLSTHRVTPSALAQAHELRAKGVPVFADNGSKALIDDVLEQFADRALAVRQEVRQVRHEIGCVPRGRAVPVALRAKASQLAQEVVDTCTALSARVDADELLNLQMAMRPTHVIAQEDFATGCLVALGLEREITGWGIEKFILRNERSLDLFERVRTDPRCQTSQVFAVLSAMDYNTARSAGRLAAAAGVDNAAIGMAGITADPTATDFFVIGNASYKLAQPTQRRYVRVAQVLRGIMDGYQESGRALSSFHALGLGASAMFPVLGAVTAQVTAVTTDATSPIHDAVKDKVLYDPEHNGNRMSTVEIVHRIVNGGDWPFSCPFCAAFRDQYGHSAAAAVTWFAEQGQPLLTKELVASEPIFGASLPLFASVRGTDREREASRVHIAHNHFVLGRLAEEYPAGQDRREFSLRKIADVLAQTGSGTIKQGLLAALKVLHCPAPS